MSFNLKLPAQRALYDGLEMSVDGEKRDVVTDDKGAWTQGHGSR